MKESLVSDNTVQDLIEKSEAGDELGRMSSLFYKNVYIPSLARDIVLFGKQHGEEIIAQYGLDAADLAQIIEMPVFKTEIKNLRIMMDEGVMITAQMKAAAALEDAVDVLASQLIRDDIKPNEVCTVVRELKMLATMTHTQVIRGNASAAKGDEVTSSAGMVLNFSFGDPSKLPPVQKEPINITPVKSADKMIEAEDAQVVDTNMFKEITSEPV
jgi:hypothetical protein